MHKHTQYVTVYMESLLKILDWAFGLQHKKKHPHHTPTTPPLTHTHTYTHTHTHT